MKAMQPWTEEISVMQQTVLISAVRGMDGMAKFHPAKGLLRYYRRCILISAFDGRALTDPMEAGGGSFTGPAMPPDRYQAFRNLYPEVIRVVTTRRHPSGLVEGNRPAPEWWRAMQTVAAEFVTARDEFPLHFFSHTMHAFEILGYKHPDDFVRLFWRNVYGKMVHSLHVWPENVADMNSRLGDNEAGWHERADADATCSD